MARGPVRYIAIVQGHPDPGARHFGHALAGAYAAGAREAAFVEQVFRPSFIFPDSKPGESLGFVSALRQKKALAGKSARIVATMA